MFIEKPDYIAILTNAKAAAIEHAGVPDLPYTYSDILAVESTHVALNWGIRHWYKRDPFNRVLIPIPAYEGELNAYNKQRRYARALIIAVGLPRLRVMRLRRESVPRTRV